MLETRSASMILSATESALNSTYEYARFVHNLRLCASPSSHVDPWIDLERRMAAKSFCMK